MLLIEADSGRVLHAENATLPWYPASVTKVMTAYVALQAVKNRRLTLDSLLTVSARASSQAPSKMGFKPGIQITLDNALKMLMVKSANDVAVVIAEGVSGSVEKFSDEMNRTSATLGMTQSSWVNPNGLPAENQISSARDLAILARAALHDLPEYEMYWRIPGIKFGKRVMKNYNSLIGRYPGADGMKTGFICASGFNLVATATRNGKRLIAVVLGSPSGPVRAAKTAGLLERGFNHRGTLSWLTPSLGSVESLQPISATPPDLRDAMCGPHRKRPAAEEADDDPSPVANGGNPSESPQGFMLSALPRGNGKPSALLGPPVGVANPIVVHAGAAKKPAETQFAVTREKLAKSGKVAKNALGTNPTPVAAAVPVAGPASRDAHTAPVPLANAARAVAATPVTATPAPQPASAAVTAPSSPPPGTFAPPPNQFTRSARAPSPADVHSPSWMSFAPAARAEPAPLTAVPGATAELQRADVPLPRPRPKLAIAGKPSPKPKKR